MTEQPVKKATSYNLSGLFAEDGRSGLNQIGGRIEEEFLAALKGTRRHAILQEMADNDPVIGAALFAYRQMLLNVSFRVQPAGETRADMEAAEFLESCMDDMSHTWYEFRSELYSGMLPHGWAWFEVPLKRRRGQQPAPKQLSDGTWTTPPPSSKYDDGRIGWQKFAPRAQETLDHWEFDATGGIQGMWQSAPPDYRPVFIPIGKSLHFTTESRKNNPEGRSVIRNAYTSWNKKRIMENIEAVGVKRDLAGYPVLTPADDIDIFNGQDPEMVALLAMAKKLVTRIQRDELEGAVLAPGWKLELLSSGGSRQIDTNAVITRYDQRILLSMLVQFLFLGLSGTGTYELAKDQRTLWLKCLQGWLKMEAAVINEYAVPRLYRVNDFGVITGYPTVEVEDITQPDMGALADYLQKLISVGVITPTPELEAHARARAALPDMPEEEEAPEEGQRKPAPESGTEEEAAQGEVSKSAGHPPSGVARVKPPQVRAQWSIRDVLERDIPAETDAADTAPVKETSHASQ